MRKHSEKKDPEDIKLILNKVIHKIEKQGPGKKERISNAWRKVVGEKAGGHSRPVSIRRKILTIEADSSSWLYSLSLKKRDILGDLKKELGEREIKEIRFRMGVV